MRYAVVGMALALVIMMAPAMAGTNFSMKAEGFAAAMLKNTISNLELGAQFLDVLDKANDTISGYYLFQNLWGVAYGGLILAGFNNQVTALVLNAVSGNNTDLGYVGLALSYLGSNASTVFGDANGNAGLAKLMAAQISALQNNSKLYQPGETLLQAYARAISQTIYADTLALIKLTKAIPAAFT